MTGTTSIWEALDRLLAEADVAGVRAHKLGPLAARRLRRLGEPVPRALAEEERAAAAATLVATALLERVRACCDGALVLIKGPEVGYRYPDRARSFCDLDLLSPAPRAVHEALRRSGFAEVEDPELFVDHHHLRPLQLPLLPLKIEIHAGLPWPPRLSPPEPAEIFEAAGPSVLGIAGISAPAPAHHAIVVAAHAWTTVPLGRLRDLVDVAALSAEVPQDELETTARAWAIERVWHATHGAAEALLDGGAATLPLRLWGRHLASARERTVVDNHLLRWLHPFWELPPPAALAAWHDALREELLPRPGEPWRHKLARVANAAHHPRAPLSSHTAAWSAAAGAGEARPTEAPDVDRGRN